MKLILNSDVTKLGRKGDIVDVAKGYARNYLLPKNLAIVATDSNIAIDEVAPSLRWARANIERTSSGGSASGTDAPKARDAFEENEAPF